MTFLDIAARNERAHEKKEALLAEQINLLCAYRDHLEDHLDIATRMLKASLDISLDDASRLVADRYELRQAERKVAVGA